MGLFWRELLPPPASAQLPVLGKRLWLLQTRGSRWSPPQCCTRAQELTSLQDINLGVGWACSGFPPLLPPTSEPFPENPYPWPLGPGQPSLGQGAWLSVKPCPKLQFLFSNKHLLDWTPTWSLNGVMKGHEKTREVNQKCLSKSSLQDQPRDELIMHS